MIKIVTRKQWNKLTEKAESLEETVKRQAADIEYLKKELKRVIDTHGLMISGATKDCIRLRHRADRLEKRMRSMERRDGQTQSVKGRRGEQ